MAKENDTPEGEKNLPVQQQVDELAKGNRNDLLERAKAAGPAIKQQVIVDGKMKEITVYSLRPLLKKATK